MKSSNSIAKCTLNADRAEAVWCDLESAKLHELLELDRNLKAYVSWALYPESIYDAEATAAHTLKEVRAEVRAEIKVRVARIKSARVITHRLSRRTAAANPHLGLLAVRAFLNYSTPPQTCI